MAVSVRVFVWVGCVVVVVVYDDDILFELSKLKDAHFTFSFYNKIIASSGSFKQ